MSDITIDPGVPEQPDIPVRTPIRLGQFLKFASLVESGADARGIVSSGDVTVDGEPETRRGRQLHGGEIVAVETSEGRLTARVAAEPDGETAS